MKFSVKGAKNFILGHKKISIAVVIGIAAVTYGVIAFGGNSETPAMAAAQARVTKGNIEVTVSGTGTIMPIAYEALGSNVSGTVKKLYVKNGDRVKEGEVLAELQNDDLAMQLEKARLDLDKAKVNLADSADNLTADTITAPFAGRITEMELKKGDDVSNNSVLATLQDDSQLIFNMPVDASTASKAVINQKVQVFLPDKGETVEGKVLSKNTQPVSGYNGESRAYLKVTIPAKGNLNTGDKAFGTITVGGKAVDALSVADLEWINETQIKATLAGKVTGLYIQEGQVVKKGQKLFSLNSTTNANQQKSQSISYQQSQLTVQDLEKQYTDLTVKAPLDGIISGLDIKVGEEVNSGSNSNQSSSSEKTLGSIFRTDQMSVSFPVDEVDIAKVKVGQKADVEVDALPEHKFTGEVTEIAEEGTVTNNVASFNVTIVLDNKEGLLKSGMTGNITIITAQKDNVLLIPIEAVQERNGEKFVYVPASTDKSGSSSGENTRGNFRNNTGSGSANGSQDNEGGGNNSGNTGGNSGENARSNGAGSTANGGQSMRNIKPVKVGLTNDTYAEITEGLQEGDIILSTTQSSTEQSTMRAGGMFMGGPSGGNRGGGTAVRSSGSGSSRR